MPAAAQPVILRPFIFERLRLLEATDLLLVRRKAGVILLTASENFLGGQPALFRGLARPVQLALQPGLAHPQVPPDLSHGNPEHFRRLLGSEPPEEPHLDQL